MLDSMWKVQSGDRKIPTSVSERKQSDSYPSHKEKRKYDYYSYISVCLSIRGSLSNSNLISPLSPSARCHQLPLSNIIYKSTHLGTLGGARLGLEGTVGGGPL